MHSRVFVIKKVKDNLDDIIFPDFEDVNKYINGIDYMEISDNFDEDIEWFKSAYKDAITTLGAVHKINKDKFIEALKERRINGIKKAIEILNSKPVDEINEFDLYNAADNLERKYTFLFFYDASMFSENELLDYLQNVGKTEDEFEIIASYDYHF